MGGSGKAAEPHPIGEDVIFYNAGFKSYDITRCKDEVGKWFEWVERSRKLMRGVKVSIKVLKWVVAVFIEASKVHRRKISMPAHRNPGLSDVRRWACNSWKLAIQVKVYAMNDGCGVKLRSMIRLSEERRERKEKGKYPKWSIPVDHFCEKIKEADNCEKRSGSRSRETVWRWRSADREELGEKRIAVMFQPLEEENLDGGTEEAIPLGIQFPEEDMSISDWIQQNITKLSSKFGVNFKGCEEKAKELLMKIDSNKQGKRGEQSKQTSARGKDY
ncbi:hypothetical protein H5410_050107 [Solanum commersonii]|uniref:Uncharacterized protein n=1 Tax=Solanum commersonii TaxID=4109 RepID=A0A9J5WWW7_SOLCO|nr:hypothetical protein H5410_050107 [Solanum commersonii]